MDNKECYEKSLEELQKHQKIVQRYEEQREREHYEKALKEIKKFESVVSSYEIDEERKKKSDEEWGLGYKRKDFIAISEPYYFATSKRQFKEVTIGASKIKKPADIMCDGCFAIIGKLTADCPHIENEKRAFQDFYSEIRRTFVECACGRCIVYIEVLATQDNDGLPGAMGWHLL
jgi:hypothetical protein